ncbi:hypothetical protein ACQKLX_21265 [Bosea sp. NPDC003192]
MEENLGAVDLDLTAGKFANINAEASNIEVHGEHLPESMLKMMGH